MIALDCADVPRLKPHPQSLLASTTLRVLNARIESGELSPEKAEKLFAQTEAAVTAARALQAPLGLAMARALGADGSADGDWPNQAEYAEFMGVDERTAQREWARFKAVFDDADPLPLAKLIYADYQARLRDRDYTVIYDVPARLAVA